MKIILEIQRGKMKIAILMKEMGKGDGRRRKKTEGDGRQQMVLK